MALPVMNTAKYEMELPSTGDKIEYRPFLVKEEKVLLQAMEGGDEKEIMRGLKQVISQCVLTKSYKVDRSPVFDLEYIFLKLRSKAVGEKTTLAMKHLGDCGGVTNVEFDLSAVEVVKSENHKDLIKLSDEVTVRMKYPSVDIMGSFKSDIDGVFDMMRSSIHEIYFKEELFSVEDHSKQEIDDFLNSLNSDQFAKLRDFFETMPKVKHDIIWVCEKCGEEVVQTVEGVSSFFGSA